VHCPRGRVGSPAAPSGCASGQGRLLKLTIGGIPPVSPCPCRFTPSPHQSLQGTQIVRTLEDCQRLSPTSTTTNPFSNNTQWCASGTELAGACQVRRLGHTWVPSLALTARWIVPGSLYSAHAEAVSCMLKQYKVGVWQYHLHIAPVVERSTERQAGSTARQCGAEVGWCCV
jgi:hypothetical protein